MNWVSVEDQAFASSYTALVDGDWHERGGEEQGAVKVVFHDLTSFEVLMAQGGITQLTVHHQIDPKGLLKITSIHQLEDRQLTNVELYHKQLSVLPYAASVSGAVVKATEQGVIRHQALSAMEEQTNMQLSQIRQQIELLAIQAKEIYKRKELSMLIYEAQLNFVPVIGKVYYLYETHEGAHLLSMIGPKEWGKKIPYQKFVSAVQLLADHTWKEV